jgi:hypothetical protein
MRKSLLAATALVAALALAACGASQIAATFKSYVASIGAQQYVQLHLTFGAKGPGTAKAQPTLNKLSFDVLAENPGGGSISSGKGTNNAEFIVNYGSVVVLDVRQVDANVYVKIDATGLSSIQAFHITPSEAAAAQLVFGGKWFELTGAFLDSLLQKVHATTPSAQQQTNARAIEDKLINALASFVANTPHTKTASGFEEQGSLLSLERALAPALSGVANKALSPVASQVKGGTFKVALSTSGSTLTGVAISITGPNDTGSTVTGSVTTTITHDQTAVSAPSNPTVVTKQLLEELTGGAVH